jgi:regulator of nucleoside diphosphate kinase
MQQVKKKLTLLKADYLLLKSYIQSKINATSFEAKNAAQLKRELDNGPVLVEKENFPANTVRLNSRVTVLDQSTGRQLQFTLVLPSQANLGMGKISLFAPMATAVFGYGKGERVDWEMPAGKKKLNIIDVYNARIA